MEKKRKMPARLRRALAALFAAALIIEALPHGPALIVTAGAAAAEERGVRVNADRAKSRKAACGSSTDTGAERTADTSSGKTADTVKEEEESDPEDTKAPQEAVPDTGDSAAKESTAPAAGHTALPAEKTQDSGSANPAAGQAAAPGAENPAAKESTAPAAGNTAVEEQTVPGAGDPAARESIVSDADDPAGAAAAADSGHTAAAAAEKADGNASHTLLNEKTGSHERKDNASEDLFQKLFRPGRKQSGTENAAGSGSGQESDEKEQEVSGTIKVKDEGAASYAGKGTVFYNKAVTLVFTADRAGSYTVSYLKNGKKVKKETDLREPFTLVLEDGGSGKTAHPVYDGFGIEGEDEDGNEITVSEKPDKKIVIDSRGPVIDGRAERSAEGFFFTHERESTCTVTADDGNGAGADHKGYSYYVGAPSETEDFLRKLPESKWKNIPEDKGKYIFKLKNLSGEIYLRVKDRLGNTSYKSAGPLVHEQQAPVIRIAVSDPDQKEIYTCASDQPQKEWPEDLSEYYRTLGVQLSVSEGPPKTEGQGYSGISRVAWSLVPAGTDRDRAKKSGETLLRNQSPSAIKNLYEDDKYRLYSGAIDPDKLVEKLTAGEKGYERSGAYDLYIWAVDFCGNGEEDPVRIPVFLDVSAPDVTVRMENGTQYEGNYYYRADNDGDPSNDQETPAVTIRAVDDRREGGVRELTAVLKGTVTRTALSKKAPALDGDTIVFTVEDLKKHFGDTEQEIAVTASAEDRAGNKTACLAERGNAGVRTQADRQGQVRSASFIRDAAAPVVTITYACAEKAEIHIYRTDDQNGSKAGDRDGIRNKDRDGNKDGDPDKDKGAAAGDSVRFTAYTGGNAQVTYEVEDAYPGRDRLFQSVEGLSPEDVHLQGGANGSVTLAAGKGEEKTFCCSAYGTDIAGNPALVKETFAQDADPVMHPADLSVEDVYTQTGCGAKGDHIPVFRLAVDKKAPEITLTYTVDTDRETGPAAFVYDDRREAGNVLTAYISGTVSVRAVLEEDGDNIDFSRLFCKNPGQEAAAWDQSAVRSVTSDQKEQRPCLQLETAENEGEYLYCICGTDRAGNKANVTERFGQGCRLQKMFSGQRELTGTREGVDEDSAPYYAIVIDRTAPVYRLTINNPADLQETFDRKKGIAYYGKSVPKIAAEYVVTDAHFDENRILAGIAGKTLSGAEKTESLSPEWTAPDRKGICSEKDGLTRAVFSMQVNVDRQHEGMYRFEIGGCDRAGNALVPAPAQREADASDTLTESASRTVAYDASAGSFWTQRKAVDVTAPSGFLKVRSSRGKEDYYEIEFAAGGNNPVSYAPFRRETDALVIVGSKDRSQTLVSFEVRSQDTGIDAVWKKRNPVTSSGDGGYGRDNVLKVTVKGEQAFYLEKILIRDRAGNVCADDPAAGCTLARTSNIYLDVTEPVVSAIRDAESPLIRIEARGSFTRHEADSGRYIYRPDGSSLDLEVSVADPGGKARSSGLQEVAVRIMVGDTDVTDKADLQGIPYFYKEGGEGTGRRQRDLKYEITGARISIPAGSFAESNDITISVRARDNSGNESVPARDGGLLKLGIDTTAPRVEVNYRDSAKPQNGKYFRADRVAEIVVTDRNVENGKIRIETNTAVPASFAPPHANRKSDGSGENGSKDRWIKTLVYDKDGDYTLQISGTDALGNRISDIKWNGPAPQAFTVDKTKPLIRITLPREVNEKDGVKYYDRTAAASIEIEEHNLPLDRDNPDVAVRTRGRSGDAAPAVPSCSAFHRTGPDRYGASVVCAEDGEYEITASCTDLAGNEAEAEGGEGRKSEKEAWSGRFTVDTIPPQLRLDPETFRVDALTGKPLQGLEKQIYTDRDFAPRVIIRDVNYDGDKSDMTLTCCGRENRLPDMTLMEADEAEGEYSIQLKRFEMVREMDGVYRATAQAWDLAKHRTSLDFLFSVNRFGSTYVYADDSTERKIKEYYINDTEEPLRILELSPVELKTHRAELFKDHQRKILTEGTEYFFDTADRTGTAQTGPYVYTYTIAPRVCAEEGLYDFILSSEDIAGSRNSTALFRDGRVQGDEILQVKFPIELQVDKTVPVNRITGLREGQEQFNADRLAFTIYPEDYQTDIREVEVRIWQGGRNGRGTSQDRAQYRYYRKTGSEEDAGKLARQHIYPIEEARKGILVTLEGRDSWQFLEVVTRDLAGNESLDFRCAAPDRNLPDTRRRFLVTTNPLIRFYSCRPLFFGSLAAAFFLPAVFLLIRRRKKQKREDGDERQEKGKERTERRR